MKWLALLLGLMLPACVADAVPESARAPATNVVSADTAGGVVWVDVRSAEEFATGHVAGAINIPHDQMAARWGELVAYRDRPVALYCRSGRRSGLALQVLRARGFEEATNEGGLAALAARGLPLERY